MSLTVPTGGVSAGRSANIQIETPDIGATISAFGDRIAEKYGALQRERNDLEAKRTQLAITRDMGAARLEVEQIANPAEIGPAWDGKVAEITAKYITKDEKGNLTIDPNLADQLGLSITELGDRHGLVLGQRVINLDRSQQDAVWVQAKDEMVTAAIDADPETFGAMLEQGEAWIDQRVAKGLTDPAAGAEEKLQLRRNIYGARADADIATDPAAFLAAADAGQFDALGGELKADRIQAANRELTRREKEAANAADVAAKERSAIIGRRLGEWTDIAKDGRVAGDEAFLSTPEVQAHPDYPKTQAAIALRDEMPNIKQATPAELDAAIANEEGSTVDKPYQTERLKVLRDWRDKALAGYNSDPLGTAKASGLPVPDLPDFDPKDPTGFAEGLFRRVAFQPWLKDKGYTKGATLFTPDEVAALKPVLDPKADTAPKLALAGAMVAASKGRPQDIAPLLTADPVFKSAAAILATTGNASLAGEMLDGQQKAALGTVVMPTEKTMMLTFDDITGGLFSDKTVLKSEKMAAARALYANGASGLDPDQPGGTSVLGVGWSSDPASIELFTASVQRSLGATPDANGDLTIGGIQEINGGMVSLPMGVGKDQVENAWDRIDAHLRGWSEGAISGFEDVFQEAQPAAGLDRLRSLRAASVDGKSAPDLGEDPLTWWDRAVPVRVGESDWFELHVPVDGAVYQVPTAGDPDGTTFRFRMSDLVREAAK